MKDSGFIVHSGVAANTTIYPSYSLITVSTLIPYHYITKEGCSNKVYKLSSDKTKLVYIGDIIDENPKYPLWNESETVFDNIDQYIEWVSHFKAWECGWGCPHKLKKKRKLE